MTTTATRVSPFEYSPKGKSHRVRLALKGMNIALRF
jgi:hypothetical protein